MMKHGCIIAGGALRRAACFRFPKSLAEFRRRAAKENSIIFSGDMCVGENTAFYHLLMTFSAKPGRSLTFSTVPSSSTARPLKTPNT